jgi:DNA (cytosine-5)-methyltransferase 1
MSKPRLLDVCCGGGGAAMGYARAGFEVVGVDIQPQPRYPFAFHQADALTFPLEGFDAYHASPPCQLYSRTHRLWKRAHPDLVDAFRQRLRATGKPYILENVPGAPLPGSLVLCGTMFALGVLRHRLFESNVLLFAPGPCAHKGGVKDGTYISVFGGGGKGYTKASGSRAMGIEWMSVRELSQAIPPAYTEWLGRQLMEVFA